MPVRFKYITIISINYKYYYRYVKKNYSDSSGEATAFTTAVTDASSGLASLSLTNTQTDSLKAGRYVYDVELSFVDSGGATIIERVLEGRITVTPSVTR